ncbi:MAG TPA: hypothetical protein VFU05_06185 [Cyclobacteriaceae bacterium]|nr:hypothetical protein [Cyclobacteriaceae bacterium]
MIDKNLLDKVYNTYGFEATNEDEVQIGVYTYKKSRYFGVDIVPLDKSQNVVSRCEEIKEYYSKIGYAAEVKLIESIEKAEEELYKSFFSFNATITRLKKKYNDFEARQTRNLLGNKYQYIDTPFEDFDEQSDEQVKKGLLKRIQAILSVQRPQLIIIEAAAGYGKTCAAYEVLRLFSDGDTGKTPIFTELSRNRGAKIFRYILLDEIDIEFPTLSSELVIHEVKKGRVPLIIDGFDELLDKVNIDDVDSQLFEEIETMLDTIGTLLDGSSKIILTTRKTAIFSGLEFNKWLSKWNNDFDVSRLALKEPRIKDWLGQERLNKIKAQNIPIQYIANPVLLTFLKNVTEEEFDTMVNNPEHLVDQYFDRMLEREMERQNLIISVENQYEIFKNVVRMLMDFDITVESKEFFRDVIKEQNIKLLEYTRSLYNAHDRPSIDNLVDTLATHALLDRKGRDESLIGFINDFIIGTFIGEIICETNNDKIEKDYSEYMIDLASTAYKVQNRKNKQLLWEKIMEVAKKFRNEAIFSYDIVLRESLMRPYEEITIYELTFFNISFNQYPISSSVFIKCYFKNCKFNVTFFHSVSFIDCSFDSCEMIGDQLLDNTTDISTIKCIEINCHVLAVVKYDSGLTSLNLENEILSNLWTISLTKRQHVMQLLQGYEKGLRKDVLGALKTLSDKGLIKILGSHINFNPNRIEEIKKITGH